MTNKTVIDNSERIGGTNLREESEFNSMKNFSDLFTPVLQLFESLALVTKSPFGTYSLGTLPTEITLEFNKEINVLTGTIIIYDNSNDNIVSSFTQADVTLPFTNTAEIDITGEITVNGEYRIEVSAGLFESNFEELSEAYSWIFNVVDGHYNVAQYNTNDYLTN